MRHSFFSQVNAGRFGKYYVSRSPDLYFLGKVMKPVSKLIFVPFVELPLEWKMGSCSPSSMRQNPLKHLQTPQRPHPFWIHQNISLVKAGFTHQHLFPSWGKTAQFTIDLWKTAFYQVLRLYRSLSITHSKFRHCTRANFTVHEEMKWNLDEIHCDRFPVSALMCLYYRR